jgi:putative ABC transport system permease protein
LLGTTFCIFLSVTDRNRDEFGIGVAIGFTGALLGTRYIEAQLFGVTATDPLTFVGGCVVLAIAGLTASVIPALRAMHVDPVLALRWT